MLIYTQMEPRGTVFMQLLGLPLYAAAILAGLAVSSWFPGAFIVVVLSAPLIYSFAYSKALYYFVHRLRPARPMWQFVVAVLSAQIFLWASIVYGVAA